MKKLIYKSIFTVTFGLILYVALLGCYTQTVFAETATIKYITTSVGENETSIGINYHCSDANSVVKYSTSAAFPIADTVTVTPTSTLFSAPVDASDAKTGFEERYVCKANLTGLKENTQYYYKVVTDTKTSLTYKFKTHSADAKTANILFATDIHSAEGSYSPTRPNAMMNNVRSNVRDINLLVMTGDQVDRGGYESHWESYYNGMGIFNDIVQAVIPGNHEYYHTSGGEYVSPLYFNQFYNNPQNGPEAKMNSTFYFKYGNALFIMLDIIDKRNTPEQKEWFENVVENNPAQWIIVGCHSNAITGGWYSSDSKWVSNNFGTLFEKYQVDLVIGGHEHVYIRKDLAIKSDKDADLGVTYYVSPAAQHKQYAYKTTEGLDAYYNANYKVNVISITDKSLKVSLYNEKGDEEGYEFTLSPKRNATINKIKDSVLLNSLELVHDKENMDANLTWKAFFYGNVHKVVVERTADGNTDEISSYVASGKTNTLNIGPIYSDRDYQIKVTLHKLDGTTVVKEFEIINLVPYNLNLELDDGILNDADKITQYLSGKITKLPIPVKEGFVFKGWYDNADFSGKEITRITGDITGDKTYYAKWSELFDITYNARGGSLSSNPKVQYEEGEEFTLEVPTHETETFLGWYTNEDFTGDQVVTITAENKADLTLYAKWSSDVPPVDEPKPGKGCGKKDTVLIVELLSAVSLLAICFKRKK